MARIWEYCDKCGRGIEIGEICFDLGAETYCYKCCKPVNTMHEWERAGEADESEVRGG